MAPPVLPGPLVGPDWLATRLGAPGLVILDASWYLPQQGRAPRDEFLARHIPGARWFDLDATSDPRSPWPHMLPDATRFEAAMTRLGVGSDAAVVVYDGSGVQMSAPRLRWMLRAFGHDRVAVLDGGMDGWLTSGYPLESGLPAPAPPVRFVARPVPGLIRTRAEVVEALRSGRATVADARSQERYRGEVDEPRPGVRSGHIPGSANLPFTRLVDPATGRYLPGAELGALAAEAGIPLDRPAITSCGSGVTAASLALALELAGVPEVALYDGSWAEWGAAGGGEVATGPGGVPDAEAPR